MKKFEQIPPALWEEELLIWQNNLKEALQQLNSKPKNLPKELKGRLRIDSKKRGTQFYYVEGKQKKYFSNKQKELIREMLQEDYDQKVIEALKKEIKTVSKFLSQWKKGQAKNVYKKMVPARQQLVTPLTLPAPLYAQKWQSILYKGNPSHPENAIYQTQRGERVRSKSEVLIADTLLRLGISYRYEYPIRLSGVSGSAGGRGTVGANTVYPDFTCLNLRTRQEYIWEHLGMMDDLEYAAKSAIKLANYEKSGIFLGHKLIISMETANIPLTPQRIA